MGFISKSQIIGPNMVNNPSFEIYYNCPSYMAQLYQCKFWWGVSSEYYNACATISSNVNVPNSGGGFQYALTGNAFAGTTLFEKRFSSDDYREYLNTKLKDTLIYNKRYCTTFYISLAEISFTYLSNSFLLLDSVGLLFTKDSMINSTNPITSNGVKVQNDIFNLDTINWLKISNSFIAKGGEQYMTIGNFDNILNYPSGAIGMTYIYVDDVSVCECSFEFNLGRDTTLCDGETLLLNPNMPNAVYTWQDSSHAATYNVTKPGTYWVRAYFPDYDITTSDTIEITNCNPINIPNAFTPNGDGKNDVFKIISLNEIIDFKLIIYNRWGDLIFESTDINKGWDGAFKGEIVPYGVYVYLLTGIIKDTGEQIKRTGNVTVVR